MEVERELRDWSGREGGRVTVSSCLCDPTDFPLSMNQCCVSLSHYSCEASGPPSHFAWLSRSKTVSEKALLVIDGFPSSIRVHAEETFKHSTAFVMHAWIY